MTFLLLPSIKFLLQKEKYQMEMDLALLKKKPKGAGSVLVGEKTSEIFLIPN